MTRSAAVKRRSPPAAAARTKRRTRPSGDRANQPRTTDPTARWSEEVDKALRETAARMVPWPSAWRVWQRLTAAERRQLGDDIDAAYRKLGTVGIWMRARGGTPISALLGAAREINLLTPVDSEWLLRETTDASQQDQESAGDARKAATARGTSAQAAPLSAAPAPDQNKPVWQRETGVLVWQNRELARFRLYRGKTSLVEKILNAFADAGWAAEIENPFSNLLREQVSQALYHVNEKLSPLQLHVEGRILWWEATGRTRKII